MGADPLCATCERPSHAGPCYPDVTGPLHARIADLERQLAAAITHPLAVASAEAASRFIADTGSDLLLDELLAADHAWTAAGRPLRTTTPTTPDSP